MPRPSRLAAALVAAGLVLAGAGRAEEQAVPAAGSAKTPSPRIEYRDDRLSVQVEQMPVGDLIDEIGRQSGAQIIGRPREDRQVTAQFRTLPLSEGLQRLLGAQNFVLRYGDGGRLRSITLLGGPQTAHAPAPAQATPPPPPAPAPQGIMAMFQNHAPLAVNGRLAAALGSSSATFSQLLDAAIHNDDASVRVEAMRTWLNGLESDAALRGAFLSSIGAMDDAALGNIIRGAAGLRAEELAALVASQARTSELRAKASTVLQALRQPPGG
ncbi:MAG TPA: hypothetical protein VKW76_15950 [Candidatus Binatia bacterium]|nr:hypothetical protein [Candidatus Binatia bacterium]